MEEALFSITCTTCQARLKVRHIAAVGAILACPKCQSMVQVVAPEGWTAPAKPAQQPAQSAAGGAGPEPCDAAEQAVSHAATGGTVTPPIVPPTAAQKSIAGAAPRAELPGPGGAWLTVAGPLWRKWLLLAVVPAGALMVTLGLWTIFSSRGVPQPAPAPPSQAPLTAPADGQPQAAEAKPEPLPAPLDRQWLPDRTKLLLHLQLSRLAALPESEKLIEQAGPIWRQTIGAVLRSFGLKLDSVRRLSWASTDLAALPDWSVVVIELEQGHDARILARSGKPTDLRLAGAVCHRLPDAAWPHPFAVIGPQTIISGRYELLRHLAERSAVSLESKSVERLLKAADSDPFAALWLDLGSARAAKWRLPSALMDIWPAGRLAWHVVWEIPEGLGLTLHPADRTRADLFLVCEGVTAAEKVHAAVAELLPEARKTLSAQVDSLTGKLQAGRLGAAAAEQYELLLKRGLAALQAARSEVAEETVRVRLQCDESLPALSKAALDSRGAIAADWLSAARAGDEANHRRLLAGLGGYQKAEGHYPAGAVGGALLPPETRLSWIATLLPYYGQTDWHRQLEFGYPWNAPQNRSVTKRPLEAVVNPALGPGTTEAGFPVTHYVGVAGVGPDAGQLGADHARAGVFGYGRATRLEDITDGASNTVALLGVSGQLGAWAAGGSPTVRALTSPPYVNGPDGFGSGQPDGMLAGMADGSVRFISKDVDPRVLEQVATIHGHENVSIAALDPRPVPPQAQPAGPEAAQPRAPQAAVEPPASPPVQPGANGPPQPEGPPDQPGRQPRAVEVDVEPRLAGVVPEIELSDVPLADLIRFLGQLGGLPITLDPEALLRLGVRPRDPVTVRLSGATVRRILETAVSSRGLALVVENNQVLVTSPAGERQTLRSRRYTVSDLTGGEPAAVAALADLVRELVAPDSWRSAGGLGSIAPDGEALAVEQSEAVHYQVINFCEKLRGARKLPLRSQYDAERFALATRLDRAAPVLGRTVTVNFRNPTPLQRILADLEEVSQAKILVDWLALSAAGVSPEVKGKVAVAGQPLAAALDELLRPMGLGCQVIDADVLQVTTRKANAGRLELEFYPVSDLLTDGLAGPALLERIKGSVAKATWNDAGGPGVVHLDRPSGCLIVLQSQPVQGALGRLLAGLRSEKKRQGSGSGG